ncbi:MAG: NADH-quinone oxidoreductase subunit M [Verrucomicrobia bacterium]|nr:NADH-quinone oxidoreductase subunit M [Verrucomicrobiota bacterium]
MPLLTTIIVLPLAAALLVALVPRDLRFGIRLVALAATLADLILATVLFLQFDPGTAGYQCVHRVPWVSALGIEYHVGVDGVNVGLVLLAAVVAFAAACASWEIRSREKEFYLLLLIMAGGVLGAFASLDLVFFYGFHELALVPTFIMIGVWGRGEEREYATFKITLYLTLGALLALVGLLALYLQLPAGDRTFDVERLTAYFQAHPMSEAAQQWIFPVLMFGFGILVSLWPFHTWAPPAYSAAPTPTAMLHAGVLKKFGLYGLIRIAVPLMPEGAQRWLPVLAALCLGNLLHVGWVAMRQENLNRLFANSSVAHMGFAFLGIASLTQIGLAGAVVVMVAHGFLAALMFGLGGHLWQQTRTLEMNDLGGLLRQAPFLGTATIMAMLAGCGLPGFANFAGEVLVLFGASKTVTLASPHTWVALAAWAGLVIGAVYMLRAVRRIFHGPLAGHSAGVPDMSGWRRVPFVLLLGALMVFGCFPRGLTDNLQLPAALIVAPAAPRAPALAATPAAPGSPPAAMPRSSAMP